MANYIEHYDVQLFNDIHNYFPELLYGDLNRFPDVRSVLEYVRTRIRNHYDRFSNAQRTYQSTAQPINTNIRVSLDIQEEDTAELEQFDSLTNLITSSLLSLANIPPTSFTTTTAPLNRIPTLVRQRNFMEPVIVRPTLEQINNGTSIVENLSITDICTICQDSMEGTHRNRRINHCNHTFHDSCINTWFRRNVRCPTCRHDIRSQ